MPYQSVVDFTADWLGALEPAFPEYKRQYDYIRNLNEAQLGKHFAKVAHEYAIPLASKNEALFSTPPVYILPKLDFSELWKLCSLNAKQAQWKFMRIVVAYGLLGDSLFSDNGKMLYELFEAGPEDPAAEGGASPTDTTLEALLEKLKGVVDLTGPIGKLLDIVKPKLTPEFFGIDPNLIKSPVEFIAQLSTRKEELMKKVVDVLKQSLDQCLEEKLFAKEDLAADVEKLKSKLPDVLGQLGIDPEMLGAGAADEPIDPRRAAMRARLKAKLEKMRKV